MIKGELPGFRAGPESQQCQTKQMRRVVRTIASLDPDRADMALVAAGIDPESRPETLGPEDFARLLAQLQPLRGARDVSGPGS